jgi:hypothetical protein
MRLFEFTSISEDEKIGNEYAGRVKQALDTMIGRAASAKQPANFNWEYFNSLPELRGLKFDPSLFKVLYDKFPQIAGLVNDFGPRGISLKVAGVDSDSEEPGSDIDAAKDDVNQIAASNAEKQLQV